MSRKDRKRLVGPLLVWDLAWKAVAIRRALSRKEYGWAAGILVANSVGIVPMYYLWRTRNSNQPETEKAA
ncbi:MAG: DUF5652 family protein [Dehalococcoidia bacterium]